MWVVEVPRVERARARCVMAVEVVNESAAVVVVVATADAIADAVWEVAGAVVR